jgi:hypothetical protein
MSISLRARSLAVASAWLFAGCGAATNTSSNADPNNQQITSDDSGPGGDVGAETGDDADATPPVDHGAPSTTYPAFPADQPELTANGGPVLATPNLVTVTWPNEPNADGYEAFGDKLGGTEYWSSIVSEYGVGAATSDATNHVREKTALAASVTDADLQALVQKQLGDPTSGWPAPTDQSIYVLYLPTTTKLMTQTGPGSTAEACSAGIGGYHESVTVNGKLIAVAILPQCSFGGLSVYEETTLSASHEIAEASTDPQPQDNPGFFGVDDQHIAWMSFMQFSNTENGDLCEIYDESSLKLTSGDLSGYWVQRQWSNKSAKAGHNPCVPLPSDPYFNLAPLNLENLKLTFSGQTITSKGLKIPAGQSKTLMVGFYSDAAMPAWDLKSIEGSIFTLDQNGQPTTHNLQISIDKTSGQNGEKAAVTIQVLKAGSRNHELATIVSKNAAGAAHFLPIFIDSTP